jgi:hypothetical protein
LCTPAEQVGAATVFPTRAVLDEAAARIEQMLAELRARGDASGAPTTQLEVPLAAGSPPAPISLARYCLAAGELMRLSAQGSQLQAQNYLLAAYRLSAGADDPLAARAAYRLALVGASEPAADGTRGASTGGGAAPAPSCRLQEGAVLRAGTSCEELTASGIAELTARQVSHLALACAAERATTTGDRSLAALSNLKLAHLEGAFAELPGQDREAFRGFARERAQAAIPLALQLGDDADGPTLVGRLAEAAVVYGDTEAPSSRARSRRSQRARTTPKRPASPPRFRLASPCSPRTMRSPVRMLSGQSSPRAGARSLPASRSSIYSLPRRIRPAARSTSTPLIRPWRTSAPCSRASIR